MRRARTGLMIAHGVSANETTFRRILMSRTSIAFGTAVALAFGASLGAQSPSTSTPSSSASQTPPAITVTGCLTADQAAGATGTSGTAGAAATAASGFKLTNAM